MIRGNALAGAFLLSLIQISFADEVVEGTVVENFMEDTDVGAYLHIRENYTGRRVFVVYMPADDEECVTKIEAYWVARGDQVSVRGTPVHEVSGVRPREHTLSTCAESAYIKAKRLEPSTAVVAE